MASTVQPAWIVLASVDPNTYDRVCTELAELAPSASLAIAGEGASRPVAERCDAALLGQDPVTEATTLAAHP